MITIIDYKSGNLKSISNGFKKIGCDVEITSSIEKIADSDYLVLPGVGAFGSAMENLEEFKKVIVVEGGYVNDPDDAGGETYLGISRRYNPNSKMWNIIDDIKKRFGTKGINNRLKNNQEITNEVKRIYKINYWDRLELDDIPSQKIAHELFDTAVNCGVTTSIRLAQQVCNMTITGKFTPELKHNLMQYGKV